MTDVFSLRSVKLSSRSSVTCRHPSRGIATAATPEIDVNRDQRSEKSAEGASISDWWRKLRRHSQLNQCYIPPDRIQQSGEALGDGRGPKRHMGKSMNRAGATRAPKKFQTPTEYLRSALQNVGCELDNAELRSSRARGSKKTEDNPSPSSTLRKPERRCLQVILAEYIRFVEPLIARAIEPGVGINSVTESDLHTALGEVFCAENVEYLEARGYNATDVVAWAWILKSNTTYEAALRLLTLEEKHETMNGLAAHGVPPFIPLFLLRKWQNLEPKAFRLLLAYSLHVISDHSLPTLRHFATEGPDGVLDQQQPSKNTKTLMDHNMCVSFTDSLLHHSRKVWPEAQVAIVRAFAFYLTRPEMKRATIQMNRFKARHTNNFLELLSLPSKAGPFKSASAQQQAQFELLKAMAEQDPVIPVTRQGYRGIIAVQLAHKKTMAERQSAELKAVSWPPWKEERLGIDFERGFEGMTSRAMHVINQMKHAGYPLSSWEEVAAVLAGWDTDKSPTIQTRSMMGPKSHLPDLRGGESGSNHAAIWAARIRATRTVREAWACFLSYQNLNLPPHRDIYAEMAAKLIYREKAVKNDFDQVSSALPGDGPEVFPEPRSARDVIYVDTKPPTLDELLKQMLSHGIRPSEKLLVLLLRSAPTLTHGLDYLSCSNLSDSQVMALCTMWGGQSVNDAPYGNLSGAISGNLFSAFIEFLCKFTVLDTYVAPRDIHMADAFPIIMGCREMTQTTSLFAYAQETGVEDIFNYPKILSHAILLLRLWNSPSRQPWIHLLSGLDNPRVNERHRIMSRGVQLILAWHEVLEVAGWMGERRIELGLRGFQILCRCFTKAVTAAVNNSDDAERALEFVNAAIRQGNIVHCDPASGPGDLVQNGLRVLKKHFDQLVLLDPKILQSAEPTTNPGGGPNSGVVIPPMPSVPTPAVLHAFVRALGTAEDNDGLLSLLRWMSQNTPVLEECAEESLSGRRMMRRTVVAMRVFLERPWGKELLWPSPSNLGDGEEPVFPDPNLQEAYDIIEATPLLGPWPKDREIQEYIDWE